MGRDLHQVLGDFYDAAVEVEKWPVVLSQTADLLRCTGGVVFLYDQHSGIGGFRGWGRLDDEMWSQYENYYHQVDLGVAAALRGSSDMTIVDAPFARDVLEKTEFFNEFWTQFDVGHCLASLPFYEQDRVAFIGFYRSSRAGGFDQEEVRTFEILKAHYRRAMQIHRRLSHMNVGIGSAKDALDSLCCGVVLIGAKGHVLFCNRAAGQIVARSDGLLIVDNCLRAEAPEQTKRLQDLVRNATRVATKDGIGSGGVIALARQSMKRPLHVLVAPLGATSDEIFDFQAGRASAIVFVTDPEIEPELPNDALLRIFGLTPAEARFALEFMATTNLKTAADRLRLTEWTARSYLKTIFSKTDTRSQPELIKLLLSVPTLRRKIVVD